jgi:predicted porin
MQKKIIALAIAGMSSVAFAQSNVTISGQMKVSLEGVSAGGCSAAGCTNLTSRTRVSDNNSNIRFAGTESLGNGMNAWFQIESAIGTSDNIGTTGASSSPVNATGIGTRNTAVGISGNWGNVLMGKWDAHYNSMANIEAAGLTDGLGMAASSLNMLHTINGQLGMGGRLNNVIAYLTPNFSGFTGLLAYTTSGVSPNEWTTAGMPNKENGWNMRLAYDNGPIAATFSHLRVDNALANAANAGALVCINNTTGVATTATACPVGTTATAVAATAIAAFQGINVRSNRLGAAYTFPMGIKVGLIWDKSKATLASNGDGSERSAWALPVSYKTGAHTFTGVYAKANRLNAIGAGLFTGAAAGADDSAAKQWTLGYEYSMSKRTSLSVTYVQVNNGQNGRYDFWHPSNNTSNGTGLAGAQAGADPRTFGVGVTHRF